MNNAEFELTLRRAIEGSEEDLEMIFELYDAMIYKYSCIKGKPNADLRQQLLLHIALNIHSFPIDE